MSITFSTSFGDIGKTFAAFNAINGICGAQVQPYAYLFTITAVSTSPTVGATYTNNGVTFTVIQTVVGTGTMVAMVGSGPPTGTGTLTKATGTGDATLTFSAVGTARSNWIAANVAAVTTSPVAGAIYTNNSIAYTVLATVSGTGTTISFYGNGIPGATGTLTKVSGTGDSSLTLTAITGAGANWNPITGVQLSYSGPVVKCQTNMIADILARLQGAGLTSLVPFSSWQQTLADMDTQLSSQKQVLQALAQQILIQRVNNDVRQQDQTSFSQAINEWIRQMQVGTQTVQACTVSAATTPGTHNTGNATVYASLIDANGLTLEYSFAESIVLECTQDQFTGASAGSETLSIVSPATVDSSLSYLWPGGSGMNTSTTVNDPTQGYGSGGNLIGGGSSTVGAFKAWTGSIPNGWTIETDGANIADGTTDNYSGLAHCLKLIGNTAGTNANTALYQTFANGGITGGSTVTLEANTVYQFYAKVKTDSVPAAGVVQFNLVDGSDVIVNNNQGAANTISTTISGYGGTTYALGATITGTFQTPTVMPTNIRLQIIASTPITTGSNVFIDFACLSQPSAQGNNYGGQYPGGPYIGVYRGSVDLVNYQSFTVGDRFTVAVSNNYGGSSATVLSMGPMFNRLFGLANLGVIMPSAAITSTTPSIPDNLIS